MQYSVKMASTRMNFEKIMGIVPVLLIGLIAFNCGGPPKSGGGSDLIGVVVMEDTNQPVALATVQIMGSNADRTVSIIAATKADEQGKFGFGNIKAGAPGIEIWAFTLSGGLDTAKINLGSFSNNGTIKLSRRMTELQGKIVDAQSGDPLVGAVITTNPWLGGAFLTIRDGTFRIRDATMNNWNLLDKIIVNIDAHGYLPREIEIPAITPLTVNAMEIVRLERDEQKFKTAMPTDYIDQVIKMRGSGTVSQGH